MNMIESTHASTQALKPVDPNPAAKVARNSSKAANVTSSDVAEVSTTGQDHAFYLSALRALPDVRPDVVEQTREAMQSVVRYPPMQIVDGVAALVGQVRKDDVYP